MSERTGIAWTDRTWNPVTGCTRVSEGCDHCYAARQAATRLRNQPAYQGLAVITGSGRAAFTGAIRLLPERLRQPLHWHAPQRVFVNSMSDLFHESIPDEYIERVFAVMRETPRHQYQVLTKRPERMCRYMLEHYGRLSDGLGNIWLGVSVEHQAAAHARIPFLLGTPAAVRFLSCEPLLGPLDLSPWLWGPAAPCAQCPRDADCECGLRTRAENGDPALAWVICGGESGPGARPMDLAWARELRDQCALARVPFFLKQDSGLRAGKQGRIPSDLWVREFPHA